LLKLCNELSEEDLKKLPKKALETAKEHLDVLRQSDRSEHLTRLKIDGNDYGFIPDWDAFTFGEYLDLELYAKDLPANATKVMSILYRKVSSEQKDNYWIEPYTSKEDESVFDDLPASVLGGTLVFFSSTRKRLLKATRVSLAVALKEASLEKSGVGILPSTPYQETSFSKWTRLRKRLSGLFSRTLLTYKT
tara:strand:- start:2138 stop:2713 length:576 start_codon:yes stop_codon:yes gene_type:complete